MPQMLNLRWCQFTLIPQGPVTAKLPRFMKSNRWNIGVLTEADWDTHFRRIVKIPVFLRGDEWQMGSPESNCQKKRLKRNRLIAQNRRGKISDLSISVVSIWEV